MKKITFLKAFIAVFAITLASCETEPVDPVVNEYNPDDSQNGDDDSDDNSDDNNDDNDDTGVSEGDYWPMAINNEWVFENSTQEDPQTMKIIGEEVINGTSYYKIDDYFSEAANGTNELTGTTMVHIRKDGGSYYQRVSVDASSNEGITINVSPYEYIIFKDNLEEGEGWTQTVTQTTSYEMEGMDLPDFDMDLTFEGTILEKGITVTVNGTEYNNVIKAKIKQTAVMEVPGSNSVSTTITTYMWFAKDIGPLKSETNEAGINATVTLLSYILN